MLPLIKNQMTCNVGIDLGTANSLVYKENHGIVTREPSVVAFDQHAQKVLAIGDLAYNMVGKTPANVIAIRPLKHGVISDFQITKAMLTYFLKSVKRAFYKKLRVLIGVPYGITSVERRAVIDAALMSGAKSCYLIDEPMAAIIGSGYNIFDNYGRLIVDIGGGTTEVAVISLGGIVVSESIRVAGDEMDQAILNHCHRNYNLLIGEKLSEKIKCKIGSVIPFKKELMMEVTGRDILSGLPKTFNISSMEIRDCLEKIVNSILVAIRRTLELTPPELASDISKHGILLTGGGSLLHGLANYIEKEIGVKVCVPNDPLACVVLGTGIVLSSIDTYIDHVISYD